MDGQILITEAVRDFHSDPGIYNWISGPGKVNEEIKEADGEKKENHLIISVLFFFCLGKEKKKQFSHCQSMAGYSSLFFFLKKGFDY